MFFFFHLASVNNVLKQRLCYVVLYSVIGGGYSSGRQKVSETIINKHSQWLHAEQV